MQNLKVQIAKAELRREILKIRRAMNPAERQEQSAEIARKFLASPEYQAAQSIGFYASKLDEVATDSLIEQALATGKVVVLPRVANEKLIWHVIESLTDLKEGCYGVREPGESLLVIETGELDLIVVPGVAFDRAGDRLGYGKGYYDSTLKDYKGKTVGLAFACQMVKQVPTNNFDQWVNKVLVN